MLGDALHLGFVVLFALLGIHVVSCQCAEPNPLIVGSRGGWGRTIDLPASLP